MERSDNSPDLAVPAMEKAASCCGGADASAPVPAADKASGCCGSAATADDTKPAKRKLDLLLWGSGLTIVVAYLASLMLDHGDLWGLGHFTHSVRDMMNLMWWGILVGMVAVGLIDRVPREFVIGVIGRDQGAKSLGRAVLAGFFLDLCNHGVLMVGAKLYERGASLGQVFAFLIASPWNSLSLTIIIGLMMGWGWMVVFILASLVIAFATGLIVEALERAGKVKPNANRIDLPDDFHVWREAKTGIKATRYDWAFVKDVARRSVTASRMVLRWLFFGVVLAALIQVTVPTEIFATWFGATFLGLLTTLVAATIIEVCSEGSVPIAADLMTRAQAPGNAFTFLMAGAATDYTEILVLKEVTGRLKAALLLPLLTVPQVVAIGWMLNGV
ncbi:MAG: permease [Rhizobiales bacterium]|nr:permease [Hyphomicrobiales bacterium]MBO6699562.1 permease [Hyphomicrobiales bacterium]MBO6737100.1 permease [Hyphomicrobiales bacterium]MBO6911826.1 permease [Hyphomicrobiales bacterium]MBO6954763.1 permease [Hyphomicrobiales bacterium]